MLRTFLIYLSKAGWAQRMVTGWKIAWWTASRFVAGESIQDAIQVIRVLNEKGIVATLDQLGEHTTTMGPRKVLQPPEWLGWCLMSVGAVLILHSLAMKGPGG